MQVMSPGIEQGYKLPLLSAPPSYERPNQKSALEEAKYVEQALKELVELNCVQLMDSKPHICSLLSVVVNSEGKRRLVFNIKLLN